MPETVGTIADVNVGDQVIIDGLFDDWRTVTRALPAVSAGESAITESQLAALGLPIRPRLRMSGHTAGGFLRCVTTTPTQLLSGELASETPEQVIGLAKLAHTKYVLVLAGLAVTAIIT